MQQSVAGWSSDAFLQLDCMMCCFIGLVAEMESYWQETAYQEDMAEPLRNDEKQHVNMKNRRLIMMNSAIYNVCGLRFRGHTKQGEWSRKQLLGPGALQEDCLEVCQHLACEGWWWNWTCMHWLKKKQCVHVTSWAQPACIEKERCIIMRWNSVGCHTQKFHTCTYTIFTYYLLPTTYYKPINNHYKSSLWKW